MRYQQGHQYREAYVLPREYIKSFCNVHHAFECELPFLIRSGFPEPRTAGNVEHRIYLVPRDFSSEIRLSKSNTGPLFSLTAARRKTYQHTVNNAIAIHYRDTVTKGLNHC
jgi:hypothetical protein